ncbi:type I 3-dehydroquinate dehydratase [Streptomyces sp. TRM 70361]|uniref:type I 3-dehydroquinate dehydratase n=1 Tax=Streptomyces sp. TRM 70361 TaxID=3116553 RepID=UPI002E7BE4A4|nr:type I 3-dehydroquinate dehydratase [Streptomyces sp. TRM 70361]MEE1942901.1 type I 3-dehydroquinate dehydratase [Streptomyces sp. TRM 70361]
MATGRAIKTVTVGGVTIGEGAPKVIAPLTGGTSEELYAQAEAVVAARPDLAEWRVDLFSDLADSNAVTSTARALVNRLAGIPLLFTCRTRAEGGRAELDDEAYGELNASLVRSAAVDLVDVEYRRSRPVVERVLRTAHEHGVPVVASNHDFDGTPPKDEIVARLREMQELGADICKIAVMPHSAADVLTLLDATRAMREEHADRPLITMAMGGLGLVSRLSGRVFGSAATFGAVGAASAPGQIDVAELRGALELLDRGGAGAD